MTKIPINETKIKNPAAAAGPGSAPEGLLPRREGLWPGGSCGALKFKTYFHVVIPAPVFPGINSSRNPGFPAKAGIPLLSVVPCFHRDTPYLIRGWIPTFVGMTDEVNL